MHTQITNHTHCTTTNCNGNVPQNVIPLVMPVHPLCHDPTAAAAFILLLANLLLPSLLLFLTRICNCCCPKRVCNPRTAPVMSRCWRITSYPCCLTPAAATKTCTLLQPRVLLLLQPLCSSVATRKPCTLLLRLLLLLLLLGLNC